MKKWIKWLCAAAVTAGAVIGGAALLVPPPPEPPKPAPFPAVEAAAASVIDGNTGVIRGDKAGEKKIYPASTTKILTCIIALEEGQALLDSDAVITPRAMAQDGTDLGVRPDMPISLREVLYGMMLVSGNDAAVAVAETVGGSYDRFIEMMNEKAASIGVSHSHFANPNGLTRPDHYTTSNDMVKIAAYAMKNPAFREIVKQPSHPMVYRSGMYRIVENRNELLPDGYPGVNGIKTGMTEAAGECLVASAERDGRLVIAAVYDDENRWDDAKKLLDYGFAEAEAEKKYKETLAAEPAFYKWVNHLLGRDRHA